MILADARCTVGESARYRLTADELVAELDRHGVARAVVGASDRELAVANREGNDLVLEACEAHPERLIGFAAVNPWFGDDALSELRRATEAGLRGLILHPQLQGFLLLDPVADPVVALAGQLGLTVYVHTGTPVSALPFQLTALARRHPSVSFVMGQMGHTDFWIDALPAALGAPNIYAEISYKQPQVIEDAVATLGPDRVVFGSDAPRNDLGLEVQKFFAADLDEHARRLVAGENLLHLLGEAT